MSLRYSYVDGENVRDKVHDHLIGSGSAQEDRKFVGYFMSQSLWKICNMVDTEKIVEIDGGSSQSEKIDCATNHSYSSHEQIEKDEYEVSYRSGPGVGSFDVDGIKQECDELGLRDVCVTNVTVRIDDDELYNELYDILDATGVYDMDMFEQPIYAEMNDTKVPEDMKSMRRWMRDKHPSWYFGKGSSMNWNYRTLELDSIWSRNAWVEDGTVVARGYDGDGLTVRDLEEKILNYHAVSDPVISPVNSRMVTRAWRNALDLSNNTDPITGTKVLDWSQREGWNINGREVNQ